MRAEAVLNRGPSAYQPNNLPLGQTGSHGLNRDGTRFIPGTDAPHINVRAWTLFCFHSLIITYCPSLLEGADSVGGQVRGYKECPFSGVTNSGRVWRKVPESDARSVQEDFVSVEGR